MKHYKVKILGKVQGVGFRYTTMTKALELGIKGFVTNQKDGSVYAEFEGDSEQLQLLIAWCRDGPPTAQVQEVEVVEGQPAYFNSFEIRR